MDCPYSYVAIAIACEQAHLVQGSILPFFQTRQPGKDVRKDACPDIILLARSKLCNN